MKALSAFPLAIALLLVACDKQEPTHDLGKESPQRTKTVRTPRPLPQNQPNPRKKLRTEFTSACELNDAEDRNQAIAQVAWNAHELDPELAQEALHQLPSDHSEKILLIQHFAMRLAEQDPEQALEWAATVGSEAEIAAAFGKVALVISDSDPERAARILSESGISGDEFDRTVVEVLNRWATKEPAEATAWVLLFPEGRSRDAGIRTTLSEWLDTDASEVFSWSEELQNDSLQNEVARAMADILAGQPQDLREQTLTHATPETRNRIDLELEKNTDHE